MSFWKECCARLAWGRPLPKPSEGWDSLEECELRYREMDILHHMALILHTEDEWLDEKRMLCERINQLIVEELPKYERRCANCGNVIPAVQKSRFCRDCRVIRHGQGPRFRCDDVVLVAAI